MRRIRAFTLIEVLVVVAIIAMLIGILMPSLKEVRRISRRTACAKNLDQIGVGMHAYLMTHKDIFPWACRMPSWEQQQAAEDGRDPLPSLPEVLKQELNTQVRTRSNGETIASNEAFLCPADRNTMCTEPGDSYIPTERYFDNEGTSYEWEDRLNGENIGFNKIRIYAKYQNKKYELAQASRDHMWMAFDFEPFHGGANMRGSHNVLYTDLHVEHDNWEKGESGAKEVGKELD